MRSFSENGVRNVSRVAATEAFVHATSVQDPEACKCHHGDGVQQEEAHGGKKCSCMDMEGGGNTVTTSNGTEEGRHIKQGTSSFFQALINCTSLLYGLGILASPYAVAHAGWLAVGLSLVIALSYWYTSTLLYWCMRAFPHLRSYQDIAQHAFGTKARVLITAFYYAGILGTLVGYSIALGDNLSYVFHLPTIAGLAGKNLMIVLSALVILPTVWLRNLSALSFTTIWSVVSTIVFILTIFFAATINHIGFTYPIPLVNVGNLPVAAGLYALSYSAAVIFPNIYASMKNPSDFPKAMVISMVIATISITGLGVMGAYMFGEKTESQITLNMPSHLVASKIVLGMIIITSLSKYALLLSPVTSEIESLFPWNRNQNQATSKGIRLFQHFIGTLMRSMFLLVLIILAMALPYFNYILSLMGSTMTIVTSILPCLFYLKLFHRTLKLRTILGLLLLVCLWLVVTVTGTISSIKGLIKSKSGGT